MATYSLGTSIKVNAAVFDTDATGTSSTSTYTAPVNGYAIVQCSGALNNSGQIQVYMDGVLIYTGTSALAVGLISPSIYVGPLATVSVVASATVLATSAISGVEFKNSP